MFQNVLNIRQSFKFNHGSCGKLESGNSSWRRDPSGHLPGRLTHATRLP